MPFRLMPPKKLLIQNLILPVHLASAEEKKDDLDHSLVIGAESQAPMTHREKIDPGPRS
jgi:hypothetical protein